MLVVTVVLFSAAKALLKETEITFSFDFPRSLGLNLWFLRDNSKIMVIALLFEVVTEVWLRIQVLRNVIVS